MKKETELNSVLGQAANIRLHSWSPSQWTLNFVPGVYRNDIPMENQTPQIKEPQDLYLDSLLPKKYANYLCNRKKWYIPVCLSGYDPRPIDKYPLFI